MVQSTTNVLRSYDQSGVGTRARDSSRYGSGYGGGGGGYGGRSNSREVDSLNTTWDTMGRGLSRRPYDDSMASSSYSRSGAGESSHRGGGSVGRYSGLRASGGLTINITASEAIKY